MRRWCRSPVVRSYDHDMSSPVKTVIADDGVALSVRRSGSQSGPVIVFVHGFPDDSHVWSGVLAALDGSAQLITYDVRGAGASAAPAGRSAYRMDRLVGDLRAVVDAVSPTEPVHLVGHDWGSTQAFHAIGTTLAGRVASFTSISGPHLGHARAWIVRQMRRGPVGWVRLVRQTISSAYLVAFVVPGPIDLAIRVGLVGRLVVRDPSRRGTRVARADVRHGLNIYRANLLPGRPGSRMPRPGRLDAPVQVIVPTRDRYVSGPLQAELDGWVPDLSVARLDAGHWLMLSHPTELAERIRTFVARASS
jgi:pimeloyl-ACP methyl ester carboxylesterase